MDVKRLCSPWAKVSITNRSWSFGSVCSALSWNNTHMQALPQSWSWDSRNGVERVSNVSFPFSPPHPISSSSTGTLNDS